jgi:putative hemolysin
VGEIRDETDREHRGVQRLRDGSLLVDASLSVHDLAEQHHLHFPESPEYDTLAGFILSHLQRIPRDGEVVTFQEWRLTVVGMEGRRVARVKIERRARGDGSPRAKDTGRPGAR